MALAQSMPRMVTLKDGRVEKDERRESGEAAAAAPTADASEPATEAAAK